MIKNIKFPVKILAVTLILLFCGCSSNKKKMQHSQHHSSPKQINETKILNTDTEIAEQTNVVFFDFDSDNLHPDVAACLSEQINILCSNPKLQVTVEGHCDRIGTREYNMCLGERRAEKIKRYLISCGISSDRIKTISYGKEKLFSFGNTAEDDQKNRRGIILISSNFFEE